MMNASKGTMEYFLSIEKEVKRAYDLATRARKEGLDPEDRVDIPLAKNVAEKVEGLVSAAWPEILGSGVAQRINELEKEYSPGDWRVALLVSEDVAKEKFCKFPSMEKAIETAVRVGLAYSTLGIVSAPLEGFVELKIKKRRDGKEYLANYYAGPIRASGGTASSISVLIADYLRVRFGLEPYDPTDEEVERYYIEMMDYHARVSRLQYLPTKEEVVFIVKNLPIEINGDPTSLLEVSNYKDIPRAETTRIRGGMCLVLGEGICQKAKKMKKNMDKWGKEMGIDWSWLDGFLKLQSEIHSGSSKEEDSGKKLKPNYVFMEEAVAGRPILAYPLKEGGFRLRYGRSRLTGLAAAGVSPATMGVLFDFVATGTQLKVERPGKGCAVTPCNHIAGPVVRLNNGDVVRIKTHEQAKKLQKQISQILFVGDILFSYGDFYEQGHFLVPSPYVPEWWVQDIESAGGPKIDPFGEIGFEESLETSKKYGCPLHPDFTLFWSHIDNRKLKLLLEWIQGSVVEIPLEIRKDKEIKSILEEILLPHQVKGDKLFIPEDWSRALLIQIGFFDGKVNRKLDEKKTVLENINNLSSIKVRDVAGIYVGARLGRPEKAKMRTMKGRPQTLFPCGQQGGRMRDIMAAIDKGFVESDFPSLYCKKCDRTTVYRRCEVCDSPTEFRNVCMRCGKTTDDSHHCGLPCVEFNRRRISIRDYMNEALKNLGVETPVMLKGVRGTFNKTRLPERLEKGILRAVHNLYVNKDGTVRYDMIETPVTHFRPFEVGTSLEKLRKMGYEKDIFGKKLEEETQMLELKVQDVILPDCDFEGKGIVEFLINVANFVDDELVKLYKLEPFYNISSPNDLIGQMVIGLAPHTSSGIVGRIVGFTKTQGYYAHPYFHAGMRRNCDGDEAAIILLMDGLLNFSRQYLPDKRGSRTMDAPLVLTIKLDPNEVDSEVHNLDIVSYYPKEFYEKTLEMVYPWEVSIKRVANTLGKPEQYEGICYTHPVDDMNSGVLVSSYKTLLQMLDKVEKQMDLAERIKAVDAPSVASMVIEKHFIRDLKGNLRKLSRQSFRCIECNEIYRRIPLTGRCKKCGGRVILTVAEGTVNKYLKSSFDLVSRFHLDGYIPEVLEVIRLRIDSLFGKERERQEGLMRFIGSQSKQEL
jgi:DNA polymerase II large subunit